MPTRPTNSSSRRGPATPRPSPGTPPGAPAGPSPRGWTRPSAGTAMPAGSEAAAAPDASGVRPVEWLLLGYSGLVCGLILSRAGLIRGWGWLLLAHGVLALAIWLAASRRAGPRGDLARDFAPLVLLLGFYAELGVVNRAGGRTFDAVVQGWEYALFRGQPSRDWWRAHPSGFWSLVLHGAYLSYYAIVLAPAVWFALRRREAALRHFVLVVMTAFIACYVCFLVFPVAGPYYEFPRPSGAFVDNVTARLVYGALARGSAWGAAFPSSHVAATAAATVCAWRGSRTLGIVLVIPATLLAVAVVYCQMHYAVDAIAGLAVGLGAA